MPYKYNPHTGKLDYYEAPSGGAGGGANLAFVPGISNGVITSDSGSDATILLADSTNAGLFSAAEKTKLTGIQEGAEANVQSDWNAVSGDALILNKPETLPSEKIQQTVKAGVAISKGQAVYVSGSDGTNVIVAKASNASEATSSKTLGLLFQDLALNGIGKVITEGRLEGLDTSLAQVNDPVWLGIDGNLIYGLANKPVAPAHLVYLGVVTRVNVNNGEIFVKVQNGYELDELHDVSLPTYINKGVLYRDTADNLWKHAKISSLLTLTTEGTGAATLIDDTLNIPIAPASSQSLIPDLTGNEVFRGVTFRANSTTIDTLGGITNNLSGTQGANTVAVTNFRTRQITMRFEPSVTGTGNYCCMRTSAALWSITAGFLFVGEFGIADTNYAVGAHNFWGLTSSVTNLAIGTISNLQPSALTNIIALANDSGDANLQIMHNDASGTATKIDLGSGFPANRTSGAVSTTMYYVRFYNAPGSSEVKYSVINRETGAIAEGTITTNLPDASTLLAYQAGRSMGTGGGGVSSSGRFDVKILGVYNF